jgi:signal transduction histidine kinase
MQVPNLCLTHICKIWVENNLAGGVTFGFMLPYEQEVD